jgi:GntR family transcriptional regulator
MMEATTRPSIHLPARDLAAYMAESLEVPGRTKRTAARLAISSAIRDGVFAPGDKLPPEIELAAMLGIGLGTVQVALRQLQEIGSIIRRRGDGTRVASAEPLDPSVWHFRFIRLSDGMPLHADIEWVRVALVPLDHIVEKHLGKHIGCHRIRRRCSARGCAPFATEMYINPDLNIDISQLSPDELRMVNIRSYLEDEFNIIAGGSNQTVILGPLPDQVRRDFDLPEYELIYEIHALTTARDSTPIYFQRIYVPATEYALNFINSSC